MDQDKNCLNGDEVVISGISGMFPNSESVSVFMANLFNKVDMITSCESRWKLNDPDVPKYMGQIKGSNKFDAQFFGVTFHLARVLDPMGRKLLEHTYGAIFDSGTSLQSLRGTRVGVFIGSAFSDNSSLLMYDINKRSDHVINGGSRAMLANRISYWIDGKGPSYGLDYADGSSTQCLERAYHSIKTGECDSAIVGGCNYGIHPMLTLNMRKLGLLCLDGKTKCFDKNADGYVRADAINVIFLQKAKDAHRIYAQVYHAMGAYKMRPDAQFLPFRESEDIENFLNEFYSETDINPNKIEYVEAQGAAIAKADESELKAISNFFAKERSVKVGSVKSNMGNSEAASGLCSVTKLCLAYHEGKLPANLHYNEPHAIPALQEERIQIVTKPTTFNREFTAINSFSYTGANFHILLKGHFKEKNPKKYTCEIPRLLLVSGRQEPSVRKVIDIMKNHPIDPEEIALLNKAYENDIIGHIGRGYVLLDTNENNETVSLSESVQYYSGLKRPLWFVYSGMGSQWAGMGADLMRIPTFASAIYKCHEVLKPQGIDLLRIVTEPDNSIFDNTLNAFVGIGAVQIGLTDVIKEMGIVPDSIIGHSLGEMACAYHDNTFTAEELILSTYSRGKVVFDNPKVYGSMAAVGLGHQVLASQCPPDIDIACHNSSESSTLSGPADKMKEFVGELTKRGVFAREVPCGGIAYHSRYIEHCGPELFKRLSDIIKNPKKRSTKWISTSVPQDKWNEPEAVYSSATYHTNNLLRPVLFEEMSKFIPDNAIVVEIAPHGLLQAILKRSHKDCTHIPLTQRGNKNGVKFLFEAFGKIYEAGVNFKIDVLYPKVEFPVSTETPLLSHFVDWEHSEEWPELSFLKRDDIKRAVARNYVMSIQDDDYKFLEGHIRNGVNVLPESAILVFVWETISMNIGQDYRKLSVIFKDIQFYSEVLIKPNESLRLHVSISVACGKFEVTQHGVRIASGNVCLVKVLKFHPNNVCKNEDETQDEFEQEIMLNFEDVYTLLQSRGYSYKGAFQCIKQTNLNRSQGYIQYNGDWVTFLDSLIQFNTMAREYDGISVPKFIRQLKISTLDHYTTKSISVNGVNCFEAQYNDISGILRCAGVELNNVTFFDKPLGQRQPDVLLSKAFYPYYSMKIVDLKTAIRINLQIVAENTSMNAIKVNQIVTSNKNINSIIKELSHSIPDINIGVFSLYNVNNNYEYILRDALDAEKANLFIFENIIGDTRILECLRKMSKDTWVLALESGVGNLQDSVLANFSIVSAMSDGRQILMLLKSQYLKDATYIRVNCDNKMEWMSRVHEELNKTKRVVLVSERQPYCGALGFVKSLLKSGQNKISLMAIDDFHAPSFDPEHIVYKEQLAKNITVNILRKGEWGGYYYQPAKTSEILRNVTLTTNYPDNLDSLTWNESVTVNSHNNLVQVSYAGISLNDVKNAVCANGCNEIRFGMDYSGIDINGERVMGLVSSGSLSTTVEADPTLTWPVPEHWSLQDAATVPLPYAMAYYCICIKSQLFRDDTVLIVGGAGALGQAIITLCLSLGCKVFTTVSSVYKRNMLLKLFPQLDENNIGYSRDDSFLTMIKVRTENKYCDVVINSSNGFLRETAMKCLGFLGLFLDLSSYDMAENHSIGMAYLEQGKSYNAVDFSNIFKPERIQERKVIQRFIFEGIANGIVKPISRVEYTPATVSKAFRFLSLSKHVGKVLIKMRSPQTLKKGFEVTPKMTYCSNGVYIVVCDEGGLGIKLTDRLIKRGAKKIVLHLRSKVSGYLQTKFISWQKYGVSIKISSDKIQTQEGCVKLIKDATRIGSIKGIFIVHALENDKNAQESVQEFNKINVVINLDITSRNYCNDLRHFVLLSVASKCPSEEFALSVFEKVYNARTEIGMPALVVRAIGIFDVSNADYYSSQTLSEMFNAMESGMKLKYNNILSYNVDDVETSDSLNKLANIIGISDFENISSETTIKDLKLNENNLIELKNFIRYVDQIDYPIEKIQQMSIDSIKSIGTGKVKTLTPLKGLNAFYTCIHDETEHMYSSHPIIPMITLVNNGIEKDLDPTGTYVTLIPGFEGRPQIFDLVTERLKVQAVAIQLAVDLEGATITEMAANIRKFMNTKFYVRTKFYLLGYSFGVNIAMELAALLEKEGHTGVVFCLDSSPDALKLQLNSHIGDLTQPQLQNAILKHMYSLITRHDSDELNGDLENIETWSEKVNICLKKMTNLSSYSHMYKRHIIESAYNRVLLATTYKPEFQLESQLILIKGIPFPSADDLTEDYNLSKYTKKPVKIFHIKSEHTLAPYDCGVTNIVNKLLDNKILEDYKKKNLCDLYRVESK